MSPLLPNLICRGLLPQLCLVLATLLCSPAAAAEEADGQDANEETAAESEAEEGDRAAPMLDEVVVQDSKAYPELKHDRAAAGTVLKRDDFDDAADSLPRLLDQQVGVRVTRMGGPGAFSTLSIRGSTSDQILVVLDGVLLNSAAGGPVDLSRIPLGNVARIEIYRGTAPVAFGGSAIGGLVSVSTRNGKRRELSLSAGGGSYGAREARLFYGEPMDGFDLAIGIDYSGWEGAFPYSHDNGTRFDESDDRQVQRRNNDYNQLNFLGKARLRLNDDWRLTLMDWLLFKDQGISGLGLFETEEAEYTLVENLAVLKLEGLDLLERLDWRTILAMRFSWSALYDPLSEVGLGADDSSDKSYAPEMNSTLDWRILPWWDLSLHAGYRYERFDPSSPGMTPPDSDRHDLVLSAETGFAIDVIDLLVLPSGRMEWARSSLPGGSNAAQATAEVRQSDQLEGGFRLALVNQSIPDTRLSVSAGKSVRLPSLFELFGNSGKAMGNPGLNSESAYSVDLGIVYESTMLPYPYRLRLECYGFYSHVGDLIQFVQTAQNFSIAQNIDKARLAGLELGAKTDLFGHLRLSGNYTYLYTENIGEVASRKGRHLPGRPASKWFIRAEAYLENLGRMHEGQIYFEGEWTAGNFLDNANLVALDARLTLNAGVAVAIAGGDARLSFAANNLTDEQTMDLAGYPVPGRTFHFLFSWSIL